MSPARHKHGHPLKKRVCPPPWKPTPEELADLMERAHVARLELEDATEDMNDAIREVERVLAEVGFKSGWVPIPPFPDGVRTSRNKIAKVMVSDHALNWDGERLNYYNGKQWTFLLQCPRAARKRACRALWALGELLRAL